MSEGPRRHGDELTARVGETRRLTFLYCDVVGSTELSGRQEPETYHGLMSTYRVTCRDVIESRFEGHIIRVKGDGLLSAFGYPLAHENDAERAVRAGLALVRAVHEIPLDSGASVGELLEVRVAVHRGPVYIDFGEDDIDGFAANVGHRFDTVAEPGTVVISDDIRRLVEDHFEIEPGEPQLVKGIAEPILPFRVVRERPVQFPRSWTTPLVERATDLAQLRRSWAHVATDAAGRTTGVLVRGDAGVGKSRLVAALTDEARAAGARVLELHGSPFHRSAGFHPVRSLVEARCGIDDDANGTERLESLARDLTNLGLDRSETVALLAPVLRIDPSAGYEQAATEGQKLEEQVAQAVLRYVLACTRGQAAIVVAENVHWFDRATRSLLTDLLRDRAGRVLVLATSRDNEQGAWETIELQPLTLAGRLALLDALGARLAEEDRLALANRSGGIPLYVEALFRAGAAHQPATAAGAVPVPGSVPEVLYEPLVARLYRSPEALPVAATAAAAGQVVDRSLLAATVSISAEALDSTLEALVDAGVLEPVNGRSSRYQFRHELLREVAYELLPPSRRRKVHDRLCDLLKRDEPSDLHVLASHFRLAGRDLEAAEAYEQMAEWARRRGALDEAREHLTHAIDLVIALARGALRDHREVQLRLRRGFVAMSTEGAASVEASADFDRCLQLAAADPRGDDMFSTLISLWPYYLGRAELDRAREVTSTLRDSLGGKRDFFRPHNRGAFGVLDWFSGDFADAADELAAFADDLTGSDGEEHVATVWFVPNDPTVAMLVHLALARFMAADVSGAAESLARARALAAPLDFPQGPWSAAYATWLGSWIWIEAGRLDLADAAIAELVASSARHGFASWELIAATQTAALDGVAALRSGTSDASALAAHAEALSALVALWQELELRVFLPFYLTTAGALLAAAGAADDARERYDESLALAAQTGMRFYDAETMRRVAHLSLDREATAGRLSSAFELARSQAARPFELRIALDLHDLLGDDARPLLKLAIEAFDGGAATAELERARERMVAPR